VPVSGIDGKAGLHGDTKRVTWEMGGLKKLQGKKEKDFHYSKWGGSDSRFGGKRSRRQEARDPPLANTKVNGGGQRRLRNCGIRSKRAVKNGRKRASYWGFVGPDAKAREGRVPHKRTQKEKDLKTDKRRRRAVA